MRFHATYSPEDEWDGEFCAAGIICFGNERTKATAPHFLTLIVARPATPQVAPNQKRYPSKPQTPIAPIIRISIRHHAQMISTKISAFCIPLRSVSVFRLELTYRVENNATWFGEICVCSCLTVVPGPAWVLLNYLLQTFFFSTLYFVSLWGTALPLSSAYVIYGGSLIHIMWQPNLAIHPPMNALKYSAMLLFLPLQLLCPILAMMMTMPVQSRRVGDTLVKCWLTVCLSFALKLDDKKKRVFSTGAHIK